MDIDNQNQDTGCLQLGPEQLKTTFRFLDEEEIEFLCPYLELGIIPAETILMTEGEPGDFMGFLVNGRLAVKKETSFAGKYVLLAILDPGSMVGEISMMNKSRRTATVTAMEESRLLTLTRQRMDELIEREPRLGIKVLRRIIQILSLRLQGADERLIKLL